jgi:heme A synthase
MSESISENRLRAVRIWLLCAAAMIFLTLIVGGATRLTESGLSITEWKPLTGVLPPLNHADWQAEFQKYQAIPQYRELNEGMSLAQFQTIYWWEWTHRLLARSTGMVFLLPFLYFLRRRGARRGRLVDGVIRTRWLGQGGCHSGAARISSDARLRDLRRDRVDHAAACAPPPG